MVNACTCAVSKRLICFWCCCLTGSQRCVGNFPFFFFWELGYLVQRCMYINLVHKQAVRSCVSGRYVTYCCFELCLFTITLCWAVEFLCETAKFVLLTFAVCAAFLCFVRQ